MYRFRFVGCHYAFRFSGCINFEMSTACGPFVFFSFTKRRQSPHARTPPKGSLVRYGRYSKVRCPSMNPREKCCRRVLGDAPCFKQPIKAALWVHHQTRLLVGMVGEVDVDQVYLNGTLKGLGKRGPFKTLFTPQLFHAQPGLPSV